MYILGITDLSMIDRGRNVISEWWVWQMGVVTIFIGTSYDGTARLWECGSGQCIQVLASTGAPINGCGLVIDSALIPPSKTTPSGQLLCVWYILC